VKPKVSIIIPCYNEAETVGHLLEALARQDLARGDLEVLVSDGMSDDGTRRIVEQAAAERKDLSIRMVDNPTRSIPAALNRAIETARGETLVRLDAHSIPADDYVRRCLEVLEATGAANVGGVWEIRPGGRGWVAKAIARAASHPLGAGDARYRIRGAPGEVDTVPFGAFRREWVTRVGPFDEGLLANEDYEFNYRLRQAGGKVWFDPSIRSTYFARRTLPELWRQYSRYGYWKARMLLRYPRSLRWRQALPPLFVLLAAAELAVGALWTPALGLLGIQWTAYAAILLLAGTLEAGRGRDASLIVGLPAAWGTMHIAWGASFWKGIVEGLLDPHRT
jgi:cellulose synthase/poly-beta-1,6-N-acetylglucosamine synthase-like glycosyltransferase